MAKEMAAGENCHNENISAAISGKWQSAQ